MTPRGSKPLSVSSSLRALAVVLVLGTSAYAQGQHAAPAQLQQSHSAPEIQPGLAVAGLVLLAGGTLILMGRRRPAKA